MAEHRGSSAEHHHAPRSTASRGVIACLFVAAVLWAGCSVEEHYEVLSFFFDGVPDPSAETADAARRRAQQVTLAVVSSHSAYIDRRCSDCHGETAEFGFAVTGFSDIGSEVCLDCHGGVTSEFPLMHGPVAAGECLVCHQPHESVYPDLLRTGSPELCLNCHDFELRSRPRSPVHEDLSRDCLHCHAGHGGTEPYFLQRWDQAPSADTEEGEDQDREDSET